MKKKRRKKEGGGASTALTFPSAGERGAPGIGKPWERKNPQESHPTRWDRPISRASHKTRLSSQSDAARTSFRYGWGSASISLFLSSPLCSVKEPSSSPAFIRFQSTRPSFREIYRRGSIRAIDRESGESESCAFLRLLESRTCLIERKRKGKKGGGGKEERWKKRRNGVRGQGNTIPRYRLIAVKVSISFRSSGWPPPRKLEIPIERDRAEFSRETRPDEFFWIFNLDPRRKSCLDRCRSEERLHRVSRARVFFLLVLLLLCCFLLFDR